MLGESHEPEPATQRVAVVTGAGRGIGRAEAIALARTGFRVVVSDIAGADETARLIAAAGGTAVARVTDLRDWAAGQDLIAFVLDEFHRLDVVVNNAGVIRDRMCFNLTEADWDEVLDVNLKGTFALCHAAASHWKALGQPGDGRTRCIVNTTSESGLFGNAGQANYAAAKAGVAALTLTLAGELWRYGVRVNAVAPRARTPMSETGLLNLWQRPLDGSDPLDPSFVAKLVAWLVSDAAAELTGQVLGVSGFGIQVFEPWRPVTRMGFPADDRLGRGFAAELYDGDTSRRVPPSVSDLFSPGGP